MKLRCYYEVMVEDKDITGSSRYIRTMTVALDGKGQWIRSKTEASEIARRLLREPVPFLLAQRFVWLPTDSIPAAPLSRAEEKGVLLVEDDDNDALFFQRAYERCSLARTLTCLGDGHDAMTYLKQSMALLNPLPSLIVTDLKMPKVTGLELLAWVRQQPRLDGIPVFVLSSSDLPRDRNEATRLGATHYFVKPAGTDAYMALVKSFAGYLGTAQETARSHSS